MADVIVVRDLPQALALLANHTSGFARLVRCQIRYRAYGRGEAILNGATASSQMKRHQAWTDPMPLIMGSCLEGTKQWRCLRGGKGGAPCREYRSARVGHCGPDSESTHFHWFI
jgi:hypothetical protein